MRSKFLFSNFIFILFYFNSSAQYKGHRVRTYRSYSSYGETGRRWLKRNYMSASLPFMNLQLDSRLMINRGATQQYNQPGATVDTAISLNQKCSGSFGFSGGSYFPIIKIDEKDMIALDIALGMYVYKFKFGAVQYSVDDILNDVAGFYLVDFPIALMYKSGGEVSLDPRHKMLFSIGAGFDPTLTVGGYNSAGGGLMSTRTFLMAEIGAHIGLGMKLRATWYPSSLVMIDDRREGTTLPNSYGSFKVAGTGTNNVLLSFVLLFNSMHWGD